MTKQKQLKITLIRSLIGRLPKHLATVRSLGLRKMNSTVTLDDTPCNRGMVNQVNYLLKVEELS